MADTICDDTGTKKYQFNSCHNVTFNQFKNGVTYVSLMEENVKLRRVISKLNQTLNRLIEHYISSDRIA